MQKINFIELPPRLFLRQVAKNCPKAALTYMDLWERKGKNNRVLVCKKDVRQEYLTNLATFNHNIFLIGIEGLASYSETDDFIAIELVDWNEETQECE
jgi:hypothetical protein